MSWKFRQWNNMLQYSKKNFIYWKKDLKMFNTVRLIAKCKEEQYKPYVASHWQMDTISESTEIILKLLKLMIKSFQRCITVLEFWFTIFKVLTTGILWKKWHNH